MTTYGRAIAFLACGVLAAALSPVANGWQGFGSLDPVTVTVRSAYKEVAPGGQVPVVIIFQLDPSWHIWSQAGGVPPEAATFDGAVHTEVQSVASSPEGAFVTNLDLLKWPDPHLVKLAILGEPQDYAVFEGRTIAYLPVTVPDDAVEGQATMSFQVGYQACDDKVCLMPMTVEAQFTVRITESAAPPPIEFKGDFANFPFELFEQLQTETQTPGSDPTTGVPQDPVETVPLTPAEDLDIMAELEDFDILGTTGGSMGVEDFLEFVDAAESGTTQAGWFEGKGPLVIVLLVILGGIALNLTPCVLPLMPINLAIIGAGAQAGSRARGFALGGTYGLAMAVVYGALGLIVIRTTATFGAINQTIWFNIGIAVLFVLLGLAMLDVFAIDFTKLQGKFDLAGKGKRGTFALAFGMGGISALLAGACVAPVVIQVIVYSGDQYAKGSTIALALPFFLGFGMALPWPFAGAGLSFLPKPGTWMVRVKQAMGVFILAFAAYYGYLGWKVYDNTSGDATAMSAAVQASLDEDGWIASPHQGLAQAMAEDKLVFIDMWATWCKNCLAMDKTTFKDEQVLARLEDYVKIKYQAENTRVPPASDLLELLNLPGLPAYAILRPKTEALAAN